MRLFNYIAGIDDRYIEEDENQTNELIYDIWGGPEYVHLPILDDGDGQIPVLKAPAENDPDLILDNGIGGPAIMQLPTLDDGVGGPEQVQLPVLDNGDGQPPVLQLPEAQITAELDQRPLLVEKIVCVYPELDDPKDISDEKLICVYPELDTPKEVTVCVYPDLDVKEIISDLVCVYPELDTKKDISLDNLLESNGLGETSAKVSMQANDTPQASGVDNTSHLNAELPVNTDVMI